MEYELEKNRAYQILKSRDADIMIGNVLRLYSMITPLLNEICIRFDNYTLHDINHSLRVMNYMCEIAGETILNKLSNTELVMIIASALLHDVGMRFSEEEATQIENNYQFSFYLEKNSGNKKLALQDFVRPIHGKRSYQFIMNEKSIKDLLCDTRLTSVGYYEDIALICQSHMENIEWINDNLKESFSSGDHFNSKYIALLLRIADYIDFDSQRAPQYLFEHKTLNSISQVEWEKHATICNIEKVDPNRNEIYFDIKCNDFHLYCKLMDTIEAMNKEITGCVSFSNTFSDGKYHLQIKNAIRLNIDTLGFSPERFSFSLDYYQVTNLLMGEKLYGERAYGLRELLQNSLDACSVMKEYYKKTDPTINYEPEVSIIYDFDAKKVIVKDNGTGMSQNIISKYFLTIGKSYYRSDEYEKLGYKTYPTGTFGIGFLSSFMLSSKVEVNTKYFGNGEQNSFLLEKDSKYICKLNESFSGPHGTSISLSMNEFQSVFYNMRILQEFIDMNFYRLDACVKVYKKNYEGITNVGRVMATRITNQLNIDLSEYLRDAECKAYIETSIEEFKVFDKLPSSLDDISYFVLLSKNNIQLVDPESLVDHVNKKCVVFRSAESFEALLTQAFDTSEGLCTYGFDVDELINYYEKCGFYVFSDDFDLYKANDQNDWWINSDEIFELQVCVLVDSSIDDVLLHDIIHRTKIRYLLDVDALSIDHTNGGYIAVSHKVVEGYNDDDCIVLGATRPTSYNAKVCYRGVSLNGIQLQIPSLTALVTEIRLATNILKGDFIPSVTRNNLTSAQIRVLSYAVGKAVHMYLLEELSDDEEICTALRRLIDKEYREDGIFLK